MGALGQRSGVAKRLKRLLKNESGNMGVVFGFALLPIIVTMGTVYDLQRAMQIKSGLQSSLDAATLFAAQSGEKDSEKLKKNTEAVFLQNFDSKSAVTLSSYKQTSANDRVVGTAELTVKTTILPIVGIYELKVSSESTVFKSGTNIEVALLLDNTGSMGSINPKTGTTAMNDLKAAAKKFVEVALPEKQGDFYTKIAAIPFNNSVNLGSRAEAARGTIKSGDSKTPGSEKYTFKNGMDQTLSMPITNCVTERVGKQAYSDSAFGQGSYAGWAYLNANNPCAVQELKPLTTDSASLKTTIDNMTPGGSTAVLVGIGWGWYTLSPNVGIWSGAELPAGYDKITTTDRMNKVKKILVIMTDAESNSAYADGVIAGLGSTYTQSPYYGSYPGSGDPRDHIKKVADNGDSYKQASSICSSIKATGIEIYVITFQLNKSFPERVKMVGDCATDAGHILDADAGSLDSAFATIADAMNVLRIAN